MTRYKIIGLTNLILGSLQLLVTSFFILFVIPKLMTMYSEMGVDVEYTLLSNPYTILGGVMLMGLANLFVGCNLFFRSEDIAEKFYKYGLGLFITSLALIYYISYRQIMTRFAVIDKLGKEIDSLTSP